MKVCQNSPTRSCTVVPTQRDCSFGETSHQDYDQDRFYYNSEEDTREVLQEFGYTSDRDEEHRVKHYW